MDDPIQGEVRAMLRDLDDGFPNVETMTAPEARAILAERRLPTANIDDVRAATDVALPGAAGDIPGRTYHPHGDPAGGRAGIVFYHGGGFVLCDIESHDAFCRALARGTDAVVVSVGYRLAPEHRAPAAALDAYAAYRWVVGHAAELGIDPARVAVAGDSAGGNLAAVTAIRCREQRDPRPAAQLLIYPVIDPSFNTESYRRCARGYLLTADAMRWYWGQYLDGASCFEPPYLVAPGRADSHAGLPPAVVVTAGLDPLHSEGCGYARRLGEAGVRVVHRDFPGLFHGFATMLSVAAAASALSLVCRDLRAMLAPVAMGSAPR